MLQAPKKDVLDDIVDAGIDVYMEKHRIKDGAPLRCRDRERGPIRLTDPLPLKKRAVIR